MAFSRKSKEANTNLFIALVFFCQFAVILYLLKHYRNRVTLNLEDVTLKKLRQESLKQGEKVRREVFEMSKQNETHKFFESLRTEAFCPLKVRIGGVEDGGKVVCDPSKIKDGCTIMSVGLNNQILFDEEIQSITDNRCNILGADTAKQNATTQEKYGSMRGTLFVGSVPDTLKLYRMMIDTESKEVEVLKMDIEGAEHHGLEPFLNMYFVCQLLIEIHGNPATHLDMLKKISRLGFRMFNYESNPICPVCCEYSFINEMCMNRYQVTPLAIIIT